MSDLSIEHLLASVEGDLAAVENERIEVTLTVTRAVLERILNSYIAIHESSEEVRAEWVVPLYLMQTMIPHLIHTAREAGWYGPQGAVERSDG